MSDRKYKRRNIVETREVNEEVEIDLMQLLQVLLKNIKKIILCALLGVLVMTAVTVFLMEKKYQSTSRIYLKPEVDVTGKVDYSSVNSNNLMVNNYMSVMQSDTIRDLVADELNIESEVIKNGLSVTNETDTQIIIVSCTTNNPQLSKDIVEKTVNNFFDKMKTSLSITNMEILDAPKVNKVPVSPSKTKNMILGGFAGALIAIGYIFIKFILDKRLKNKEEAENYLGIPVLGVVPDIEG